MRNGTVPTQIATGVLAVVFCTAMLALPTAAQAPDSNGESAVIVAHLSLPAPSVTQMVLQKQNGKQYLYMNQGQIVVDVTRADHPSVVSHAAGPSRAANGQVEQLGSDLAVSEQPEGRAAAVSKRPAHDTVNVLDTTDPLHPQVLRTFSGVTSILPDVDRNLIFIANNEGLWIVRHRVGQGAYAKRHLCTSESALTPEPDCY